MNLLIKTATVREANIYERPRCLFIKAIRSKIMACPAVNSPRFADALPIGLGRERKDNAGRCAGGEREESKCDFHFEMQ